MEIILRNDKSEVARFGLKVKEDADKGTGSIEASFSSKVPALARLVIKGVKSLDDKDFDATCQPAARD